MVVNKGNALVRNYVKAEETLNDISELKDNWNENGAKSFSSKLIERCRTILKELVVEPFVVPTACGSIQFEYELKNGDYLEFEIYEDRVEAYIEKENGVTLAENLVGTLEIERMNQMVLDFYGKVNY